MSSSEDVPLTEAERARFGIGACDVMAKARRDFDFEGITEHLWSACIDCSLAKSALRPRKEELFPNGPPPWIVREQEQLAAEAAEASEADASQKRAAAALSRKKPVNAKLVIAPEDVDEHLEQMAETVTDAVLKNEVKKLKHTTDPEARRYVIALRKRQVEKKAEAKKQARAAGGAEAAGTPAAAISAPPIPTATKEDSAAARPPLPPMHEKQEKVKNTPQDMPWQPAMRKREVFPLGVASVLNRETQKRFSAILTNLMIHQDYRFAENKTDVKQLEMDVAEEREEMFRLSLEQFVKTSRFNGVDPLNAVDFSVLKFVKGYWARHWRENYNETSSPATVSRVFVTDTPLPPIKWPALFDKSVREPKPLLALSQLLVPGKPEKIALPNIQKKCCGKVDTFSGKYPESQTNMFPIERDEYAADICADQGIEFCMDATTACHLLCDSFPGVSYNYVIPLSVEDRYHKGSTRRLIVLGKPRVMGVVSNLSMQRTHIKCTMKGMMISHMRRQRAAQSDLMKRGENPQSHLMSSTASSSGGGTNTDGQTVDDSDPLSRILNTCQNASNPADDRVVTGKRYSVFSLCDKPILIRSSPPLAVDGGGDRALSVQPVHELIGYAGASVLSDEERFWNHCKTILKQSQEHYLMRMTMIGPNAHVLQSHLMCSAIDIKSEETKHLMNTMLAQRSRRLHTLLESISTLNPGSYMLENSRGDQIRVLPLSDSEQSAEAETIGRQQKKGFLFCSSLGDVRPPPQSAAPVRIEDVFEGLEPRVPLQWQVMTSRVPGCFFPAENPLSKANRPGPKQGSSRAGGNNSNANQTRGASSKRNQRKKRARDWEREGEAAAGERGGKRGRGGGSRGRGERGGRGGGGGGRQRVDLDYTPDDFSHVSHNRFNGGGGACASGSYSAANSICGSPVSTRSYGGSMSDGR